MPGRLRAAVAVATVIAANLMITGGSASADPLARTAARGEAPLEQLAIARSLDVAGGGTIRRYAQRVGGLPVLGAELVAVAPPGAAPRLVSDSTVGGIRPLRTGDAIGSRAAIAAARSTGVGRLRAPAAARLGIDPRTGRLAYEVSLPAAEPPADLVVTVDALSGDALRTRNVLREATGAGVVYDPNPVVEQGGYAGLRDRRDKDSALLHSLLRPVALERLREPARCLQGAYVNARLGRKAKKVCAPGADFTGLNRARNKFEAVMAYFHVDRTRLYADSLGLSQPLRARPQKVVADAIRDDNSFYSSMTRELVLGTGGIDDGEDADVIVHEYGHSLQDQAAPGSLRTRKGATMGEGFGDYMAAAMSAVSTGGSPFDTCIFDWDGIPYSPTRTCGRRADRPYDVKKAERKCGKEIHCVGEVWSTTLFDLRTALGADAAGRSIMDRVVLESNFMLARKSDYKAGGRALIAADQLLYGGAHAAAIQAAMTARKFCKATC